ncbi:hypothetical protein LEP1GSC050_2190 [Leptospira broomii serovar Hurstbridge str. 5399]|uniref:Uncharacterized protein n=1 Tax=Leptospira broomii serovar Hurstbridge str. 5399 TaxID=1049789 RepID=T0GH22_9LEPT|nr:hypothetical protein LEP1GSC050_2190 [Leptospira broomii serovar Hurstbridge str. 5399]
MFVDVQEHPQSGGVDEGHFFKVDNKLRDVTLRDILLDFLSKFEFVSSLDGSFDLDNVDVVFRGDFDFHNPFLDFCAYIESAF